MAKILIVDDEPRIRELIHEHLQYAGYICEEAGDGSAALAQLCLLYTSPSPRDCS